MLSGFPQVSSTNKFTENTQKQSFTVDYFEILKQRHLLISYDFPWNQIIYLDSHSYWLRLPSQFSLAQVKVTSSWMIHNRQAVPYLPPSYPTSPSSSPPPWSSVKSVPHHDHDHDHPTHNAKLMQGSEKTFLLPPHGPQTVNAHKTRQLEIGENKKNGKEQIKNLWSCFRRTCCHFIISNYKHQDLTLESTLTSQSESSTTP